MLAKTNFTIGEFICNFKQGMIRRMRVWRLNKTPIAIKLVELLYNQGVIRAFKITPSDLYVFYKMQNNRHIITEIKIISKPGKRCYWNLSTLSRFYHCKNFAGFYIISTQKGLFTSDYCLLQGHMSGEVVAKVEL